MLIVTAFAVSLTTQLKFIVLLLIHSLSYSAHSYIHCKHTLQ